MKTKAKFIDNCECHFEVEISPEKVQETLENVYAEIKKHANIPGYRVGNAPRDLIEKHHGAYAEEEVLKRLIPDGCRKAMEEHNIEAVAMPDVSDVVFNKGEKLTFKGKVEVKPKVKLGKYKGLRIKKVKVADTSDAEVNETLARIQSMHATFEDIKEPRPVKKNDHCICDVEVFIDGKLVTKKHENMWIEAEKSSSMLGLGEKLIGASKGAALEIDTELPKDYPDKQYAGKLSKFKVMIKDVKEKKLPPIDDELAKKIGYENIAQVQENIKKQIFAKKESDVKIEMENQIIKKLLDDHKADVPKSMVERQFDIMAKHMEEELMSRGVSKNVVDQKKKEFEPKLREDAENKVRLYFILNDIAKAENIKLKEEDVEKRFQSIAAMSGQDVDTVKQYYETNDLVDGLLERVREEKTMDWLISQAEISD